MSERDFFDMSSKQSLVMGLLGGIAIVSIIGLGVMMFNGQSDEGDVDKVVNTNTNTNTNTAPTTPPPPPPPTGDVSKISPVTNDDYIRGDKNAEITMIEYSDFQCPFCKRHNPTMDQILSEYEGKVRLVYRHFPLNSIHPNAQKAAEASECAGEQGKFWEMHDKMFENQSAIAVTNLKSYAGDLGLNQSQFDSCLDDGKYAGKVNKQAAEAQASGISGTPGTWVGDQLVKGAYPVTTFSAIIDGLLK